MKRIQTLVRLVASPWLTLALGITCAATVVVGTILEATKSLEWAQWYIYNSRWYVTLLGVFAANITIATLIRRPWRWSHPSFAIVPVGLLLIIAGALLTSIRGTDGRLILRKGETASSALLTHVSKLTLLSRRGENVRSVELGFSPGPVDWQTHEPLDFGEIDGVRVRVLRFYRHAHYESEWVSDDARVGEPAIQVAISELRGGSSKERWYVPTLFGSPPAADDPEISISQISTITLRDEFLEPPTVKPDSRGVLSVHYKDSAYSIPVDGNMGKRVPVGESGLAVEIVEYYANAKSTHGQFVSKGTQPENPMLQLQVFAPDQPEPVSEIAYANKPFVNYATIKKQVCPAQFWYHHPAAKVGSGFEFLQTGDGRLYCRVGVGGVYQSKGELKPGDSVIVPDGRQITLLKHLRHAHRHSSFAPSQTTDDEAAVEVELALGPRRERVWLGRNDLQLGIQSLATASGPLIIMFGYERIPLGFALKLVDVQVATPKSTAKTSYVSQVELSDHAGSAHSVPVREITQQNPLRFQTFTISQSGIRRLPNNVDLSVLRVTSDPGQSLKYLGGALCALGLLYMFVRRVMSRPRSLATNDGIRNGHSGSLTGTLVSSQAGN